MDIVAVIIPIADALYGPLKIYPQFLTTKHRSIFSRPYSALEMGIKTSTISIWWTTLGEKLMGKGPMGKKKPSKITLTFIFHHIFLIADILRSCAGHCFNWPDNIPGIHVFCRTCSSQYAVVVMCFYDCRCCDCQHTRLSVVTVTQTRVVLAVSLEATNSI